MLQQNRPYRYISSPRRIVSFLVIGVVAAGMAHGSGSAQPVPPASVSAPSTEVRKGREAEDRKGRDSHHLSVTK